MRTAGTRRTLPLTVLAVCGALRGENAPSLPEGMHALALRNIDYVYRGEFAQAQNAAERLIEDYPKHPAGYFFRAASIDAWMVHYQSNRQEDEFYSYCNAAVERAEHMLDRGNNDAWAHFFKGGAEGLKGNYEMRYGRWITAFRYGWKAVTILRELQRTYDGMHDVEYGIGSYLYWRSAMAERLRWLPGVKDEREEGIASLRTALTKGVYTRTASAAALVPVLANEEQHDSLLALCEQFLNRYAGNPIFQKGKGIALFGLGRYEEAEGVFRVLLAWAQSTQAESPHNVIVARYWLARIHHTLRRYGPCIVECQAILTYRLDSSARRRLDDYLTETQDMLADAMRRRSSQRLPG